MANISALTSTANPSLAIGPNGATNPTLQTDSSVASAATGLKVIGRAAAAGADLVVTSSGTDENLKIDGKGAGTVTVNGTATGAISLARNTSVTGTFAASGNVAINTDKFTVTAASGNTAVAGTLTASGATTVDVASASALAVGNNGATNPAFVVDTNTASQATGVKITGAAAAGGVAVAAISSGTNEALTIDAKGSGTITLNGTGTGAVTTPRALTSTGTGGVGYATGAGGAVTQASSRTTGVTLDKTTGAITLVSAAGSTTPFSFTVTNSTVAATDVIVVNQKSGTDKYDMDVTAVAAGSFVLTLNTKSGTTTEQPVFNFAVIKGVAA